MPYYQRSWNSIVGEEKREMAAGQSPRNLRLNPANEALSNEDLTYKREPPTDIQAVQINLMRSLLTKHVQELKNVTQAAQSAVEFAENIGKYSINYEKQLFKGQFSAIYEAFNYRYSDSALICRVFEPSALIDPVKDLYLKMLRQISKKHPCLIATWDIFYDDQKRIYLFQEFGNIGNGYEYLKRGHTVNESQMLRWAQNIYRGLEFLGEIGLVHRSINPKHIILKLLAGGELQAKLSGFRSAIIYWNDKEADIIDQPCRPLVEKNFAHFQAPEVFGEDGEYFNPVDADIWSFSATMFFFVARVYPYNLFVNEDLIDAEIKKTIDATGALSDEAKAWLYRLMRANVKKRADFDEIKRDDWFKGITVAKTSPSTEDSKLSGTSDEKPIEFPISQDLQQGNLAVQLTQQTH